MKKSNSASKSNTGSTTSKVANPKAKMATKEKATTATTATAPVKEAKVKVVKEPKAPTGPVIEILSAQYGIDGNRIAIEAKLGRKVSNKLAGSDPAPKVAKTLIVTATVDGVEQTTTFNEGDFIKF